MSASDSVPRPATTVWRRLSDDRGSYELTVVIGLALTGAAFAAALAALDWSAAATSFQTQIQGAIDSIGGGGTGEAPPDAG